MMENSEDYFKKHKSSHRHLKKRIKRHRKLRYFFRDIGLVGLTVFLVLCVLSLSNLFQRKTGSKSKWELLGLFKTRKEQIEKEIEENKDDEVIIDAQEEFQRASDEVF